MNKQAIKSIVQSKGWEEVEQLLKAEFNDIKIDTATTSKEIGQQYLAKTMAIKSLNNVLSLMNRIKNDEKKKEVVYK